MCLCELCGTVWSGFRSVRVQSIFLGCGGAVWGVFRLVSVQQVAL